MERFTAGGQDPTSSCSAVEKEEEEEEKEEERGRKRKEGEYKLQTHLALW